VPVPPSVSGRKIVRQLLAGDLPSPANTPPGCKFHKRCAFATAVCSTQRPVLSDAAAGHQVACHHHATIPLLPAAADPTRGRTAAAEKRFALWRDQSARRTAQITSPATPNKETAR
jgi:oligopeptide/dipeptide ABC transporter ATP-binding protein